jgi:hypothetical protein
MELFGEPRDFALDRTAARGRHYAGEAKDASTVVSIQYRPAFVARPGRRGDASFADQP